MSLVAALAMVLLSVAWPALAQVEGPPARSVVMVSNTDGQRLNLRAGPAADQPVVAKLSPGEVLTVTGPGGAAGVNRDGAPVPGVVAPDGGEGRTIVSYFRR